MEKAVLDKINLVYNTLEDEESRKIYNAKLKYIFDKNQDEFEKEIMNLYNDWHCIELDKHLENAKGIILFGCGKDGQTQKEHLEHWGYKVDYFCDNDKNKIGKEIDGIKILSVDEVVKGYMDYLVIISSRLYGTEMYHEMIKCGFEQSNILLPQYGMLIAMHGKQYFDVWKSTEQESYIDCGSYNGDNIFDFLDWTNGTYKKIIAIEPMKEMCDVISERCDKEKLSDVTIINGAVWNKRETVIFSDEGPGSSKCDNGNVYVNGVDIDSIVTDKENVTYIKMDIEGSELKALQGAQNTIVGSKPKLAICIYHKDEDIYKLGSYLLELVPEYKFIIRHYNSNVWETVLYAYVE